MEDFEGKWKEGGKPSIIKCPNKSQLSSFGKGSTKVSFGGEYKYVFSLLYCVIIKTAAPLDTNILLYYKYKGNKIMNH